MTAYGETYPGADRRSMHPGVSVRIPLRLCSALLRTFLRRAAGANLAKTALGLLWRLHALGDFDMQSLFHHARHVVGKPLA
jgi:hypothetical protein